MKALAVVQKLKKTRLVFFFIKKQQNIHILYIRKYLYLSIIHINQYKQSIEKSMIFNDDLWSLYIYYTCTNIQNNKTNVVIKYKIKVPT